MKSLFSKILILFGVVCIVLAVYLIYDRTNPRRIAFTYAAPKTAITKKAKALPVAISIPKVAIALPVFPANIIDGQWEATTKGVSYLQTSPVPGEKGNSIIYGHNWPNLLGKLVQVKPGDEIKLTYNDKTEKIFEVEYTIIVTPDQTHILAPSNDKRITIYTCTGFLDSKRYVVVALLK